MTLPSQVGRISGPGARVTRKRSRGKGRSIALPLFVILILAGGGYFAWGMWLSPQSTESHDQTPIARAVDTYPPAVKPATKKVPDTLFPMPTATLDRTSATTHQDADPLVYDKPAVEVNPMRPAVPAASLAPVLIPLPEVPVESVKPTPVVTPLSPVPSKPATLAKLDADETPKPIPGTPMIAPATPTLPEDASIVQLISQAMDLLAKGDKLQARAQLSYLLFERHDDLAESHANIIRSKLKEISDDLIFSKRVIEGDTVAAEHLVHSGDYLGPIAQTYHVTYPLLEAINKVKATRIWAGMKLKVIKGPFHCIVDKSDYLMDVFLKDDKGNKVYVATYPIGLGEQDSTPIGMWRVRPNSKVTNPSWADPRTGKVFQPDDPDNPIGEYWLGIEGTDENTKDKQGYGIHGTTEAQSIGQQMSMGCIRMRADDLVWVYVMLVDKDSTVQIRR